jgi:hypothetical protein
MVLFVPCEWRQRMAGNASSCICACAMSCVI